ncbi:MAG: YgjV family protein, partial [Acholeplasmataceae bacterium]|nr:YgjV family protein [Acholeplasmataceae bacterium]
MSPTCLEWIGYIASLIVLISLLMSSLKKLRWINLAGSLIFAFYGFMIGAIPVGVMNTGIVCINIYYLFQMYAKKDFFTLLPVDQETAYFSHFMTFYQENIKSFMDIHQDLEKEGNMRFFILRNTVPAGIFVCRKVDAKTLEILLDYTTPEYRDFKVGDFLFNKQKTYFLNQGYQ